MTRPLEFAERCAAVGADLALLYAGQPDANVIRSLAQMRTNPRIELAKVVAATADISATIDLFIYAILARKREIERDAGRVDGPQSN